MATQAKLTIARGAKTPKDVAVAAGTTISGGDAIEINIDQNKLTKGEAINLLEQAIAKVHASPWPLV